jgi:hypothetical protein
VYKTIGPKEHYGKEKYGSKAQHKQKKGGVKGKEGKRRNRETAP